MKNACTQRKQKCKPNSQNWHTARATVVQIPQKDHSSTEEKNEKVAKKISHRKKEVRQRT